MNVLPAWGTVSREGGGEGKEKPSLMAVWVGVLEPDVKEDISDIEGALLF